MCICTTIWLTDVSRLWEIRKTMLSRCIVKSIIRLRSCRWLKVSSQRQTFLLRPWNVRQLKAVAKGRSSITRGHSSSNAINVWHFWLHSPWLYEENTDMVFCCLPPGVMALSYYPIFCLLMEPLPEALHIILFYAALARCLRDTILDNLFNNENIGPRTVPWGTPHVSTTPLDCSNILGVNVEGGPRHLFLEMSRKYPELHI